MRPPFPGQPGDGAHGAHGDHTLPDLQPVPGDGPTSFLLNEEPPSGSIVRTRYARHHTAGCHFTRDDAEGHAAPEDAPLRWWAHDMQKWVSWPDVVDFVVGHPEPLIMELLTAPPQAASCRRDGMHDDEHCRQLSEAA